MKSEIFLIVGSGVNSTKKKLDDFLYEFAGSIKFITQSSCSPEKGQVVTTVIVWYETEAK